jgi:hypothetical protein
MALGKMTTDWKIELLKRIDITDKHKRAANAS